MTARAMVVATTLLLAPLVSASVSTAVWSAETIRLTRPPQEGQLHPGERALVDDGSCPKGQIREIVGGSNRSISSTGDRRGSKRTDRCIRL